MSGAPHILGFTQAALEAWAAARGARPGAARVVARALLAQAVGRPGAGAEKPSQALLAAAAAELRHDLPRAEAVPDPDGTVRFAVYLDDGSVVETVLIDQPATDLRRRERRTVCLSTQVGCARGCSFCETGRNGLTRNLEPWEIVAQFALAAAWLRDRGEDPPGNVVYMGMGEPLDNLEAVLASIAVLKEHVGFAVPERRITVSTVGIVPRMDELFARTKANLAVSLHALEPTSREKLLPVARRWDLATLRAAIARAPRTVLLQWTLIAGVNDRAQDADALVSFCTGLDVRVNLIPLNPGPDPVQRAPSLEQCRAFQKRLADAGVRVLLRLPHGQQVGGACGQLAGARRGSPEPVGPPRIGAAR